MPSSLEESIRIREVKVADIDGRTSESGPRTPVRLSDGGQFRRLTPRILILPHEDVVVPVIAEQGTVEREPSPPSGENRRAESVPDRSAD